MTDRAKAHEKEGLSSDQLAEEQAQSLPDRAAMSVLGIGGISGPLPLPVDDTSPISIPEPPQITPPSPPLTPPIPSDISPEDAATLVSVAGDLREVGADLQGVQNDINEMNADLNESLDPNELLA